MRSRGIRERRGTSFPSNCSKNVAHELMNYSRIATRCHGQFPAGIRQFPRAEDRRVYRGNFAERNFARSRALRLYKEPFEYSNCLRRPTIRIASPAADVNYPAPQFVGFRGEQFVSFEDQKPHGGFGGASFIERVNKQ